MTPPDAEYEHIAYRSFARLLVKELGGTVPTVVDRALGHSPVTRLVPTTPVSPASIPSWNFLFSFASCSSHVH